MIQKPKISLFCYSLGAGGSERVVSILANKLADEFDITIVLMYQKIDYDLPKNQKIFYLENSHPYENSILKLFKLPLLAYRYKKFCNQEQIDISFSFMNRPNLINIISKLFGNKTKIIISERAMPSIEYGYNNLQSFIMKLLIKLLYNYADIITSNSHKNRLDLINNFRITKDITVLYNPIDLDLIDTKKMEKCEFEHEKYFVTIGRLDKGKNYKFLIENYKNYTTNGEKLLIIGEGQLKDELLDLIKQNLLENEIILLGKQQNPFKYIYHSKAFLFSSLHEGFSNVLLEAAACNKPIVGFTEVVSEFLQTDPNQNYQVSEFGIAANNQENFIKAVKNLENYTFTPRKRAIDFELLKTIEHFRQVLKS